MDTTLKVLIVIALTSYSFACGIDQGRNIINSQNIKHTLAGEHIVLHPGSTEYTWEK